MSKFENGLFIFRRDLRIVDNKGLLLANETCKNVYPIFIFTPEQVGNGNKFKSDNSVQFMIESLEDLASQISKQDGKLLTFYGKNNKVISDCIDALKIDYICFNRDITPYAKERDAEIAELCIKKGVLCDTADDYYLHDMDAILNGSGEGYQKFTPYYNLAKSKKVDTPEKIKKIHFKNGANFNIPNKISLVNAMSKFTHTNPNILVNGGRTNAIKQIKISTKNIKNYPKTHDDLTKPTSQLSAYIKFGCLSIREIYKIFHSKTAFIRQLYWRDFYAQVLYHFPQVIGHAMKPKYNKIHWNNNQRWFDAWCKGQTGVPIVDAGMRQMNTTGYMHNRARLIVSSYLVKTLLIDWKKGEKYFAEKLVDYDVASNNGNWQWTAGSGADSQPWFRIFNPWRQQEEHDPDCEYIKTWVQELKEVPVEAIHNWNEDYIKYKDTKYPKPIVNYEEQKDKAIKMYKDALY